MDKLIATCLICLSGLLPGFAQAADPDPWQHYLDTQATGGSSSEQEYLSSIGGYPGAPQTPAGSALDLVRQDRQGTVQNGGGSGALVITRQDAPAVFEGRRTAVLHGAWYEVSGGRLLRHQGGATTVMGSVSDCMSRCFNGALVYGGWPLGSAYITAAGVAVLINLVSPELAPWVN